MKTYAILLFFIVFPAVLLSSCSSLPLADQGSGPQPTFLPTFAPLGSPTPISEPAPSPPAPILDANPVTEATPVPTQPASPTSEPNLYLPLTMVNVDKIPDPAGYHWIEVATGLNRPTGLEHAGDSSGRLFVIEQVGLLRIIKDGSLLSEPFLDIQQRVGSSGNEQGLLGLTFHPRYVENGYFYVNYTDTQGDTVIARFRVSANPDLADPATEQQLLKISQPYANHNGGVTAFGPDGYLYLGLGDGGSGGDPLGAGQNLDTLLGKILRLDVDTAEPYAIPADNPFSEGNGRPEIWAYGLRNPWRFSFDRLTGDLYIADVGQNSFEEINFQPASSTGGENYGWNIMEGFSCFRSSECDRTGLTLPILDYPTRVDGNCSVTGGYVYRGDLLEEWQGVYLYGDYCSGRVWGLLQGEEGEWQNALLFETGQSISSFGQDEQGELYLVGHRGSILRLDRNN
jgi:glucose/arabinose dehydrogenase